MFGNLDTVDFKFGSNQVIKIYKGTEFFWEPIIYTNDIDPFNDGSGVATYNFDNNVIDIGGADGTNIDCTFITGKFNNAISNSLLDRNDHLTIPTQFCLNTDNYSISFWFKLATSGYPTGNVINLFQNISGVYNTINGGDKGCKINFDSRTSYKINYSEQQSNGATNSITIKSNTSYLDDTFHHIVITKNGVNVSMYIDGIEENSITNAHTGITGKNVTTLLSKGGSQFSNDIAAAAAIDQLRIFNRELNQEEINKLYIEQSI